MTTDTTTSELIDAATGLTRVLDAENEALLRLDVTEAVAFLPAKTEAAATFALVAERTAADGSEETHAAARRLSEAVAENRRLLERAMVVQRHVIATVLSAGVADPTASRYGASGEAASDARAALAFRARA